VVETKCRENIFPTELMSMRLLSGETYSGLNLPGEIENSKVLMPKYQAKVNLFLRKILALHFAS
jgi:hypothetical protein